jgi:hypothetical protein
MGEKISDERFHGIRITEEEKRNIRKYLNLLKKWIRAFLVRSFLKEYQKP